jgi:oxygen-independent coproporphyrinogen-3 oxidase
MRIVAAESLPTAPSETLDARLARYTRPGTLSFAALPPLGLYVHLPWCLKKCPYCDFNSHEWRARAPRNAARADRADGARGEDAAAVPEQRYLDALRADLEASLPFVWGRRVQSIFIGGGTPSLFSPEAIDRLLADIRARLPLEPGCEITLEANPGTFERDRFRGYRAAGVTRLSIGVQSFDDASLEALGRVHDAAQARAAVEEARAAFETWNLDLMYALPGQTLAAFDADLAAALALEPPHLSVYHLTIEPNTLFAHQPPALPADDDAYEMLDRITRATAAAGLERYEVSAYARPGRRCRHNLNYWQFGDYLGLGAGAHGKLTFPHRVVRQTRLRDPTRYMAAALAGDALAQDVEVARADLAFEFMLNALRLREGFELERFTERTGLPLGAIEASLAEAERRGLAARDLQRVWPTERGFDFLNDLQALFLPGRRADGRERDPR